MMCVKIFWLKCLMSGLFVFEDVSVFEMYGYLVFIDFVSFIEIFVMCVCVVEIVDKFDVNVNRELIFFIVN